MNKLILIGNGFDLAHGLKTSYSDFIKWYIAKQLNKFKSNPKYPGDELISFQQKQAFLPRYLSGELTNENSISFLKGLLERGSLVKTTINCGLLRKSIDKIEKVNWVDLEMDYFKELINCININYKKENIQAINIRFNVLRNELEEYLKTQILPENFEPNNDLKKCIYGPFKKVDFVNQSLSVDENSIFPNHIYVLDFNYTSTSSHYSDYGNFLGNNVKVELNHIHGEIGNPDNPIVFGYGDEHSNHYGDFENRNENELFTHIKSFKYFRTTNYHNLLAFLESDEYQVSIFGHSCGLSDRTLLRKIFENKFCKSVKIYFHERSSDDNDYTNKTFEIARHFTNKETMREKIVPLPRCEKMPQPMEYQKFH